MGSSGVFILHFFWEQERPWSCLSLFPEKINFFMQILVGKCSLYVPVVGIILYFFYLLEVFFTIVLSCLTSWMSFACQCIYWATVFLHFKIRTSFNQESTASVCEFRCMLDSSKVTSKSDLKCWKKKDIHVIFLITREQPCFTYLYIKQNTFRRDDWQIDGLANVWTNLTNNNQNMLNWLLMHQD